MGNAEPPANTHRNSPVTRKVQNGGAFQAARAVILKGVNSKVGEPVDGDLDTLTMGEGLRAYLEESGTILHFWNIFKIIEMPDRPSEGRWTSCCSYRSLY